MCSPVWSRQSTGYFRKKTLGHSQGPASPSCGRWAFWGRVTHGPPQSCLQGSGSPGVCQAREHPQLSPYTYHVPGSTKKCPHKSCRPAQTSCEQGGLRDAHQRHWQPHPPNTRPRPPPPVPPVGSWEERPVELTRLVHLPRAPGGQEPSLRGLPTHLCSEGVFTNECAPTVRAHIQPPAPAQAP